MNAVADAGEAGAANDVITAFRTQVFPADAQIMVSDYTSMLYRGSAVVFRETGMYPAWEEEMLRDAGCDDQALAGSQEWPYSSRISTTSPPFLRCRGLDWSGGESSRCVTFEL
jgi:hypothetical protein